MDRTDDEIEQLAREHLPTVVTVPGWLPIDEAPHDNKRLLYLARFDDKGKLLELGFDGTWEYDSGDGWEHNNGGYYWQTSGALFECDPPTHFAYQDEPLPPAAFPKLRVG